MTLKISKKGVRNPITSRSSNKICLNIFFKINFFGIPIKKKKICFQVLYTYRNSYTITNKRKFKVENIYDFFSFIVTCEYINLLCFYFKTLITHGTIVSFEISVKFIIDTKKN